MGIMSKNPMIFNDGSGIQGFSPDPAKCLGTLNTGTVFKVGAGGDVDISSWLAVALYPSADGQVEFNGAASQAMPLFAGQQNVIIIHPNITQIVPSVSCTVCGM